MDAESEAVFPELPVPHNFDTYFPYACGALQIPDVVVITKHVQSEYVSVPFGTGKKSRGKAKSKSRIQISSNEKDKDSDETQDIFTHEADGIINILAYYDHDNNLLQLKFIKNKEIPCTMFKLLGFIVHFYHYLKKVTIDRGLKKHSLKELNNFLLLSNVTDLCLDNTTIANGDYHILLENEKLRQLSLCRCNIDDETLEKIAKCLHYPGKSSSSLSILNLTTNRITDVGAKHLAAALRSNRYLSYLNLADNMISDDGGIEILDTLTEFMMTINELVSSKSRYFHHFTKRARLITKYAAEMRYTDASMMKSKKRKTAADRKMKLDDNFNVSKTEVGNAESRLYEMASEKADKELGNYSDPFSKKNTVKKNEFRYCTGNTKLCYLNVAYNNLSIVFLDKLLTVLKYQKTMENKYTGLLSVNIDGNCMPKTCMQLNAVSELLQGAVVTCIDKHKHSWRK